jgi:FlaA1/EpsC-like NDP-sugar epimerase
VLISTDKAINPTSIMGASKRAAELLVQSTARRSGRAFVAVRFGNVLGSRGSVLPVFQRQIAAGGPLTITHPEMVRYFMTIPEAVQLVLQASVLGQGGEVFVLDMGEQIRILDLAANLIEMYGLETGSDIDIVYSGIRPGEKLREELFQASEAHRRTKHEKIFVITDDSDDASSEMDGRISNLIELAEQLQTQAVINQLRAIIPTYRPPLPQQDQTAAPVRERSMHPDAQVAELAAA